MICKTCSKDFEPRKVNGINVSKHCDSCVSKKKKFKKKKPPTEQQLVEKLRKKCVALAKVIAKERDDYKCCFCKRGKPEVAIHAHHIYNEGCHKSMSADIDNLITVCFTHHIGGWNTIDPSFHRNPMEMADWFRENYSERYDRLKERSKKFVKPDRIFWENKLNELKSL